jgi:hypothetical protein
MGWRDKPYECPLCGWQGARTFAPDQDPICPECGSDMVRRSWFDTWGLTLLIFAAIVGLVLLVGYFGQSR